MRKVLLIGIGTGNPDHLTLQGVAALRSADCLFLPDKGTEKAGLAALREAIVERHGADPAPRVARYGVPPRDAANPSYEAGVADWHEDLARIHARLIADNLGPNETGAFLVWGDPGLYDSTLRILERARALAPEFGVEVIPGITSVQVLAAAHGIALNRVGRSVTLTTGRRLAEAAPGEDVVVLLDGRLAFSALEGARYDIFWGAYLGSPDQLLVSGRLDAVAGEIARVRAEARARHGWIMDIYLLRPREAEG